MKEKLTDYLDYTKFKQKTKRQKLVFYACSFNFIVVIFLFLIGKTPFSLLIPFSLYSSHINSKSNPVQIYAMSQKGELTQIQRNLILGDSFYKQVYTIIGEIAAFTLQKEIIEKKDTSRFMKKLINLQTSVLSVWKYKNKCIIYLREKTLIQLISNQMKHLDYIDYDINSLTPEKQKVELVKQRNKMLKNTLDVIEKSILLNFKDIKKVEFKIETQKTLDKLFLH